MALMMFLLMQKVCLLGLYLLCEMFEASIHPKGKLTIICRLRILDLLIEDKLDLERHLWPNKIYCFMKAKYTGMTFFFFLTYYS